VQESFVQYNPEESPEGLDDLANILTRRGIVFLEQNTPSSLSEAVDCFDQAIDLRKNLPIKENHWFLYGLIAGWMNRGDALTRLGSDQNLEEALKSYDEALSLLRFLPIEENPLFKKRHAIAWMNRGITLQDQDTEKSLLDAIKSFDETIALLSNSQHLDSEDHYILACTWMNRGNVFLRSNLPSSLNEARNAAQKALALVFDIREQEVMGGEICFKAWHILCKADAHLLEEKEKSISNPDLITETTDAVEEGMKLARYWESKGVTRFRPLVGELFSFGAHVYQIYQPQFLSEFLLENLNSEKSSGNSRMYASALEAVKSALKKIHFDGLTDRNEPNFDHLLATLRDLRKAEARLMELKESSNK